MKRFEEDLDTIVFTTRFVLWENSPIVYVFHDDDDYWQFSGPEDKIQTEDIKIVGLGEIIDMDPTIQEVADLPYKWSAYRDSVDSEWHIRKQEEENE